MKIIQDSRKLARASWKKRVQCSHCRSLIEFTLLDVKRYDTDRDGSFGVFECGVCRREIFITNTPRHNAD